MADSGKEILDGSTYQAPWGSSYSSLATFREYFEALGKRRKELEACGITFPAVIDNRSGSDWENDYHKEDDINLKAFRADAQVLRTAGQAASAQLDLLRQTKELPESWNDTAAQEALDNYAANSARMEQDRDYLIAHANEIETVATGIERTLANKARAASEAVGGQGEKNPGLVTLLNNNVPDFEIRLETAIKSMKANNPGGLGFHTWHFYLPHGPFSGGDWSADDVRKDIQSQVIRAFETTCQALKDSNTETTKHLKEQYELLLKALGYDGGPGSEGSPSGLLTAVQLHEIFPTLSMADCERYAGPISDAMQAAGMTSPEARAAFLATFAVESGELRYSTELRSSQSATEMYGPEYAGVTFGPGVPRDPDTPQGYRNSSAMLGNTQPGDGDRFRGRGPIQLTGRSNYTDAGNAIGVDLVGNPESAAAPENEFRIATWFWNNHHATLSDGTTMSLNQAAETGNFAAVTEAINGGLTGYPERLEYFNRAVAVLSR